MKTQERRFGDTGEEMAERFLKRKGYRILKRNYRTRWGELDLVTQRKGCIVFIEVKTRSSYRYGLPEDAIDWRKRRHLILMSKWYMLKEKRREENFQIDLVAVDFVSSPPQIRHLENIIEE